jgi:hypothetical protein
MIQAHTPAGLLGTASPLELNMFDDESFEVRPLSEWVQEARRNTSARSDGEVRIPAVALLDAEYPVVATQMDWVPVFVTGFNETSQQLVVREVLLVKDSHQQERLSEAKNRSIKYAGAWTSVNPSLSEQVLLHRLFVCFTVEDPESFALRCCRVSEGSCRSSASHAHCTGSHRRISFARVWRRRCGARSTSTACPQTVSGLWRRTSSPPGDA